MRIPLPNNVDFISCFAVINCLKSEVNFCVRGSEAGTLDEWVTWEMFDEFKCDAKKKVVYKTRKKVFTLTCTQFRLINISRVLLALKTFNII